MDSYTPATLLSSNKKTGCSIDFPIKRHCRPTKNCSKDCYAKKGPIAWGHSKRKHDFMSTYMKGKDIKALIFECKQRTSVRISGSGDLLMGHVPNLLKLAKESPQTMFWGMTRKTEIAEAVNGKLPNLKLLLSVDSSSPDSVWDYQGKMCFGPRREGEKVPRSRQIVTVFPYHFGGHIVGHVERHPKDCPSVRHDATGCHDCGRCWGWSPPPCPPAWCATPNARYRAPP